ncbi:hypothetical protein PsYK624_052050 [Phanerochaete sordida]|uniref:Uncharacterized protein n=1 Tax=Phanerochaete sordida TaxID=48140 RepID=A0A9P3LCR0_9APHY|nr:hypothetical protein PsYK624_052050 [Phanerochaete sordida]
MTSPNTAPYDPGLAQGHLRRTLHAFILSVRFRRALTLPSISYRAGSSSGRTRRAAAHQRARALQGPAGFAQHTRPAIGLPEL